MKARIWKDRETGAWCYGPELAERTGECPTWEDALSEVLTAMSSHSAEYGLPLRILPAWHPSPFVTTRPVR